MKQPNDAALGMDRSISRRDFLDGARVALTGSLAYSWFTPTVAAQSPRSSAYPPALTGMRGTHDGAWEVAHALRDGRTWDESSAADTGEAYDLVVAKLPKKIQESLATNPRTRAKAASKKSAANKKSKRKK